MPFATFKCSAKKSNRPDAVKRGLKMFCTGNHHNKSEAVRCLLRAGADVNTVTSLGYSALHTALHYSLPDIALLLVRAGADVNSHDFLGNSPLSLALAHQDLHMASILVVAGAPCHLTSSQRYTKEN